VKNHSVDLGKSNFSEQLSLNEEVKLLEKKLVSLEKQIDCFNYNLNEGVIIKIT
jgi:hypothetical protein